MDIWEVTEHDAESLGMHPEDLFCLAREFKALQFRAASIAKAESRDVPAIVSTPLTVGDSWPVEGASHVWRELCHESDPRRRASRVALLRVCDAYHAHGIGKDWRRLMMLYAVAFVGMGSHELSDWKWGSILVYPSRMAEAVLTYAPAGAVTVPGSDQAVPVPKYVMLPWISAARTARAAGMDMGSDCYVMPSVQGAPRKLGPKGICKLWSETVYRVSPQLANLRTAVSLGRQFMHGSVRSGQFWLSYKSQVRRSKPRGESPVLLADYVQS